MTTGVAFNCVVLARFIKDIMRNSTRRTSAVLLAAFTGFTWVSAASAGVPVPAYSSNPGAAYTVYLDLGGFSYTGNWNNQGTPGTNAAFSTDADTTTFSTQDKAAIGQIWATVAGKYAGLSVNVTTVDPAIAAGKAATDAQRQTYYDNTVGVLHTVIGGNGGWDGGSGLGVSQINVARNSYPGISANDAPHTNWIYSGLINGDTYYTAGGSAHENGHAFGLFHQSDYALVVSSGGNDGEYDAGEPASAITASYSPIMGGQDGQTRTLWRNGTKDDGVFQNDMTTFLSNPNMTLTADGIGHTRQTATALALNGTDVNPSQAKGYINTTNPANPLGIGNYTTDFFRFNTDGTAINLVLNAGADRDGDGIIDPGVTFDGSFNILNSAGVLVGQSLRDGSSLFYTYDGTLAAGSYYAQVLDFGGYASTREAGVSYFTSGDYFFTGSGGFTAVPEPTSLAVLMIGGMVAIRRRRAM